MAVLESSPLLPLPAEVVIRRVTLADDHLLVQVEACGPLACCPLCARPSRRIHSTYTRILADLPCTGRLVILHLLVRKWYCEAPDCSRRIFTERLPELVRPSARMTLRLSAAVQALGLATCGEGGARLGQRLGIRTSPTTLLRRIMELPEPPAAFVVQLGLDDWSFRRGKIFGAILVNLEAHRVLDLLPDRSATTSAAWMKRHPEIRVVSRDRSKEFAVAITLGAPQALQVLDRFHLMKNLVEQVDVVLLRCMADLRQALPRPKRNAKQPPPPVLPTEWKPTPAAQVRRVQHARQHERLAQYERVLALQQQGWTTAEIGESLGMSARTVRDWLRHFRQDTHRRKRPSAFDAFAPYVWQRWQEGCHHGLHLWEELTARGYTGSERSVYRYVQTLRQGYIPRFSPEPLPEPPPPAPILAEALPRSSPPDIGPAEASLTRAQLDAFTLTQVKWFFARAPEALKEAEQAHLAWLCQSHEVLAILYEVVQAFRRMLHQRQGQELEAWMARCTTSRIPELRQFANGLRREQAHVVAGLTHPASQGQTEGFVNKLKLIKRTMYGRAGFPLLRHRLLHAI